MPNNRRIDVPARRWHTVVLTTGRISCLTACLLTTLPSAALEVVSAEGLLAPDAVKALTDGRDALSTGRLDAAQALFKTAAGQSPRDPYPLIGLADVARLRGDAKEARESMARAAALAPGQPVVLLAQAKLMLQQRDFMGAEKVFRRALELSPDQLNARAGLAIALDSLGRRPEAKAVLDAIDIKSAKPERLAPLGNGYNAIDEGRRALQVFDQMIAAKINTAEVHVGRGDALQRLNDPGMALAAYQRAGELTPKSSALEFRRGLSLERMSRDSDAEASYRAAIRLDDNAAGARNNLAQLLARNGIKLEDALQNALRAVEIDPSAALYDTLGAVYVVRGDTELARKAFEQAVAKAPTNAAYRQRLDKATGANTLSTKQVESGLGMVAKPAVPATATLVAAAAPLATASPAAPKAATMATAAVVAAVPAVLAKAASVPTAAAAPSAKAAAIATASAPTAAAATSIKPLSGDALQAAVVQRMAAWQDAWRNKQVDSYLGFYASTFVPDKLKRSAWEQDRRVKLNKPGAIEVKVGPPTYEIKDGVVKVSFDQEYSSFNYKDTTRKSMTWVQEAGVWRIQRESTL
jgi:tetratricopeptide (TPR) repeat protein